MSAGEMSGGGGYGHYTGHSGQSSRGSLFASLFSAPSVKGIDTMGAVGVRTWSPGAGVAALSVKSGVSSMTAAKSSRKIPTLRSLLQMGFVPPPVSQVDEEEGEGWEGEGWEGRKEGKEGAEGKKTWRGGEDDMQRSDGGLSDANDQLFDLFDSYYPRRQLDAE